MTGRPSVTEAIKAVDETKGVIVRAARKLGIARNTFYAMMREHPTLDKAVENAREDMKDFAEACLYRNIAQGKEASLIFFLKTQCKSRGYTEQQDVNVDGGIKIQVIYDDPDR